MFKDFQLTFTKEVTNFVRKQYEVSSTILEYGSGGSTILGASNGKTIISTESSAPWLIEIMGRHKEKKLPGDIIPIFCDIGATKEWGHPENEESWKNWPAYSVKAWKYCSDNNINPDLILIDGRFRVACFLACCINTTSPVRILFDDYAERPNYHIATQIIQPTDIIDDRLAVFDIKPNMIDARFLLNNIGSFYNPA